MFGYYVLEDISVPDPGFPPFYPKKLFDKIQEVHKESTINVAGMSEKQWYSLLLEDSCTMKAKEGGLRSSRVDDGTGWEASWRLVRLSCSSSVDEDIQHCLV